jgi:integrase/recombinase XerD
MSNSRAVQPCGPLMRYVDGFSAELVRQGYSRNAASGQRRLMVHVSRWLAAEGLAGEDLTPVHVAEFLGVRRCEGHRDLLSPRALVPLTEYLVTLGVVAQPVTAIAPGGELLADYRRHLVVDRGLAAITVAKYTKVARYVSADWRCREGGVIGDLSVAYVNALLVRECRQRSVGEAKALVTALRSWLRFLHAEGVTAQDLAEVVPAVAGWRGGWIPRGLSEAEVSALLASVDPATPVGLRDRAVLTLLARLGLRACEVSKLVLDDVDWRQGEIVVRGKGSRRDRLPLPVDVGQALVAYVRDGRRRVESRAVFLRACAPIVGLSPAGVGQLVGSAGKRAGVPATAHRLRHSAATAMLRAGGSLIEVGQVLRHADMATTAIYAKVDHNALRTLAQPWPGRKP